MSELTNILGPTLILAGAGTGKTTTIINKILDLIRLGISEESILAVTFTNKAANEMKDRLEKLTSHKTKIWCGTFHSICLRLLKIYHKALEIEPNFIILDESDKKKILKAAALDCNIDIERHPVKLLNFIISNIKNSGITDHNSPKISDFKYKDIDIAEFYKNYQSRLDTTNSLDFDDLILKTVKLFFEKPEILSDIQDRFKYIFVDEYQDTNQLQHKLINKLASKHKNITCVGDEDQSIYGWRGAEIKHILNFPKEFENTKILKLEKNYRSTQEILNVAQSLIENNKDRYDKKLNSEKIGKKPLYKILDNNRREIEEMIKDVQSLENIQKKNIAILVRSSFQNRAIEEGFIERHIPYEIVDGVQFYERKEIKDLISYLKFLYNPKDSISFERMLTSPKRGIGERKIEDIINYSKEIKKDLIETLIEIKNTSHFTGKISLEIENLSRNIESWQEKIKSETKIGDLIENIYHNSGYGEKLLEEIKENEQEKYRIENIKEFISFGNKFNSLEEFLDHISLVNTMNDKNENEDRVKILTIHGAKGLEFEAVFIPNFEEEIIPNKRTIEDDPNNIQEERRLLYVAITRAKNHLYFYRAKERYLFGKLNQTRESSFLKEIEEHLDKIDTRNINNQKLINNFKQNTRSEFYQQMRPSSKTENNKDSLKINDKISHQKYGSGVIIKRINNFLEVQFEDGLKRIIQEGFLKK